MRFPEEIIEEKFEKGEITFEEAEKQLKRIISGFPKKEQEVKK